MSNVKPGTAMLRNLGGVMLVIIACFTIFSVATAGDSDPPASKAPHITHYTPATERPSTTPTLAPLPTSETPVPTEDSDPVVVAPNLGGDDDDHESRFCRRHFYC